MIYSSEQSRFSGLVLRKQGFSGTLIATVRVDRFLPENEIFQLLSDILKAVKVQTMKLMFAIFEGEVKFGFC
jgi:hypothetical protein